MASNKLAPVWKRIFAYAVDILLVNSVITSSFNDLIENIIPEDISSLWVLMEGFNWKALFLVSLLSGIITVFYWAILEFKIQQTLGGVLFGIRVKSETKKNKFSQFFLRNITKVSFAVLLLDSVSVLYSNKKQRYTEKLSKTITIENEK